MCIPKGSQHKAEAEAFINFNSRPDNAIRNMYYIGYTSVIGGGDDTRIFEYADWCYGAEDDEEDVVEYPLGYFFTGDNSDENYVITAPEEQLRRQLFAQYPTQEAISKSSIMVYFDSDKNDVINQMWINVRCFNLYDVPVWAWAIAAAVAAVLIYLFVRMKQRQKMYE